VSCWRASDTFPTRVAPGVTGRPVGVPAVPLYPGGAGHVPDLPVRPVGARPGGGRASSGFSATLFRDGEVIRLPTRSLIDLGVKAGDVIEHVMPGGSGYGEPRARKPELVLEDILDGKSPRRPPARSTGGPRCGAGTARSIRDGKSVAQRCLGAFFDGNDSLG